jgi:hypothetical protein
MILPYHANPDRMGFSEGTGYLFMNRVGARFAVREKCSDMRELPSAAICRTR